ncbi:MAG: hypothetical protein JNM25_05895 [Planctomycetes bacterium]|nr:hypothetical protein [Planctomycetota bacterium]
MKITFLALLVLPLASPAAAQTDPKVLFTSISWSEAESPLGFQIHLRGAIADTDGAHRYDVLYQLRQHARPGEAGPLLGDARNPDGSAFVLGEAPAPDSSGRIAFEFAFDLTRKELSGMTPLEKGRVVLRVEPQIFDKTARRFLTAPRSDALIAIADVGERGKVHTLVPFGKWFGNCYGEQSATTALQLLASLDAIDYEGNAIVPGFESIFANELTKPAQLVRFLSALPARELAFGKNNLRHCLAALAEHRDADVRAAASAKIKEAEALPAPHRGADHRSISSSPRRCSPT